MKLRFGLRPRQLLALCYAAAAIFWAAYCATGCGVMLFHRLRGEMPTRTLTADDLTFESLIDYAAYEWETAPDDRPGWYLSSDNDPHIFWQGEAYVETVRLHAEHRLPPGGVALYYLRPGQTDYRETQKVFAAVTAENEYTFALGGVTVTGLRIDPDSVGGVPTRFIDVELNPVTPWFLRFVPSVGWLLVLLTVPAPLAAALAALLRQKD